MHINTQKVCLALLHSTLKVCFRSNFVWLLLFLQWNNAKEPLPQAAKKNLSRRARQRRARKTAARHQERRDAEARMSPDERVAHRATKNAKKAGKKAKKQAKVELLDVFAFVK